MIEVTPPDEAAAQQAQRRWAELGLPPGANGRLEQLACWAAGVQGRCPPRRPDDVVVIALAGDHGVAATAMPGGRSAGAPSTGELVRRLAAGTAPVSVLARESGARVRVVDVACDEEELPGAEAGALKVRRGSGATDRVDALSSEEALQAFAVGRLLADQEADRQVDLLVPAAVGVGTVIPCAAITALLTGSEPQQVVARAGDDEAAAWMRSTAAVRDTMRRAGADRDEPLTLLARAGGADLAALTGLLVQAAVRRTPVLLDGVAPVVCALLAGALAPGAREWWLLAGAANDPAGELAGHVLGLRPLLELAAGFTDGSGALLALPRRAACWPRPPASARGATRRRAARRCNRRATRRCDAVSRAPRAPRAACRRAPSAATTRCCR
jgi:nicotinate-nucleotide--dimethylbenzimidazole phosphoribosyltransferase